MPAHKTKIIKVNLLPKDPFAESPIGKLLNWSLSIGRYIVVFTELIVIMTFLSRFTLDRQLTDLNEEIIQKEALLESFQNTENRVRQIQQKAAFIESIVNQKDLTILAADLISRINNNITYDEFNLKDGKFIVVGRAYSAESLSLLVDNLKNDPQFFEVHLDKINTTQRDIGLGFILRANYQDKDQQDDSEDNSP